MPDSHGSFTSKKAKTIKIKSAVYNGALDQVTLTPRTPIAVKKPVELVISAGLDDSSGQPVDNGQTDAFLVTSRGVTAVP
jgi:hypothetical protein